LLPDDRTAVARIVDDEVGEGAPDIDAEGQTRCTHHLVIPTGAKRSGGILFGDAENKAPRLRSGRRCAVLIAPGYCRLSPPSPSALAVLLDVRCESGRSLAQRLEPLLVERLPVGGIADRLEEQP